MPRQRASFGPEPPLNRPSWAHLKNLKNLQKYARSKNASWVYANSVVKAKAINISGLMKLWGIVQTPQTLHRVVREG